jgi:hypothetical protein
MSARVRECWGMSLRGSDNVVTPRPGPTHAASGSQPSNLASGRLLLVLEYGWVALDDLAQRHVIKLDIHVRRPELVPRRR